MFRNTVGWDSFVEHSTQGHTIDMTSMYAKADDGPSELVHDHEHPVGVEQNGLAMKKVNAPEGTVNLSRLIVILIKNKPVTYWFLV